MNRPTITPAPIKADIRVKAAPARAFDLFTGDMTSWWNKAYSIGKSPLKEIVMEPRAGGRWFERGEDGSECEWGKVLVWEPPARLVIAWQITAEWSYDKNLVTELEIRFLPVGNNETRVELEHRNLERFGDKAQLIHDSFSSPEGWPGLLKRFSEALAA